MRGDIKKNFFNLRSQKFWHGTLIKAGLPNVFSIGGGGGRGESLETLTKDAGQFWESQFWFLLSPLPLPLPMLPVPLLQLRYVTLSTGQQMAHVSSMQKEMSDKLGTNSERFTHPKKNQTLVKSGIPLRRKKKSFFFISDCLSCFMLYFFCRR